MLLDPNEWLALHQELCSLQGRVRYVPSQGNAGDALIAAGAWQLFDDVGLSPAVSDTSDVAPGEDVIFAGGGNLVPEYPCCSTFLERCLAVGIRRALVLPHTVRGHGELLQKLDERFVIACRDDESVAWLAACGTRARVIKAPDLALRMDVEALLLRCAQRVFRVRAARDLVATDRWRSYLRWRATLLALSLQRRQTMHVLRTDAESVAGVEGAARWDISNLYVSHFQSRTECELIARDMMMFFKRANAVVTNRLHVGIAAALVGCRVTYLDNSYGKIGAVYRSWLTGVPTISFAGSTMTPQSGR